MRIGMHDARLAPVARSSGFVRHWQRRARQSRLGRWEADMSIRPVKRLVKSKPTLEGAGVHLRRAFGFGNTSDFDPFLLLDDFRNDIPEDYLAGFPGIPIAESRPSLTFSPEPWNTATAWGITAPSPPATCSG